MCGVLFLGTLAVAEDEQPPSCDLPALRFDDDARLLSIYDGLRRGLEKARLPRVCLEDVEEDAASLDAFARGLDQRSRAVHAKGGAQPVAFAFGDRAARALAKRATGTPRVFVLTRYSLGGQVLLPLPRPEGPSAVVYAEMRIERLAAVLRHMLETERPRVALAVSAQGPEAPRALRRITEATGIEFVGLDAKPDAILHLRLGTGETLLPLRQAVVAARKAKIALVSDDPARYRMGLVPVVLSSHSGLVGRYAAEAARLLAHQPETKIRPRSVVAMRVLVDLRAADAQGLSLPLPFLASAFELTRGLPAGQAR